MARKNSSTTDFFSYLEDRYPSYYIKQTEYDDEEIQFISTGSLALDVAIGLGGIPTKKFTEIYGAEASGKTTLLLSVVKNAIISGRNVLFIDAEHSLDIPRAINIVGQEFDDPSRVTIIQPESMEDALQLCEIGIRDDAAGFGLVALDSIAAMTPKAMLEKELTDDVPYILARKLTQFVQRNISSVRTRDVAFVATNQVRDDTKNPYLKGYTTNGGHQWKHILSLRIMLSKAEDIKDGDDIVGIRTRFVIKKSKVGPPFRTSYIPIMFETGVDYCKDVFDFALSLGIIKSAGAYYRFNDATLGQGNKAAVETLRNDKETLDNIKNMCYNIYAKQAVTTIDEEEV